MITKEELIITVNKLIEEKILSLEKSFDLLDTDIKDISVPTPRLVNVPKQLRYQYVLLLRLKGFTYADIGRAFGFGTERARQLTIRGSRTLYEKKINSPLNKRIFELCGDNNFVKKKLNDEIGEIRGVERIRSIISQAEMYVKKRKNCPIDILVKDKVLKIYIFNYFHNLSPNIVFANDHAEAIELLKKSGVDGVPLSYWQTFEVADIPVTPGILNTKRKD